MPYRRNDANDLPVFTREPDMLSDRLCSGVKMIRDIAIDNQDARGFLTIVGFGDAADAMPGAAARCCVMSFTKANRCASFGYLAAGSDRSNASVCSGQNPELASITWMKLRTRRPAPTSSIK